MGFNLLLFFAAWKLNSVDRMSGIDDSNGPLLEAKHRVRDESIDRVRQLSGA
jgi:hypothetical protein